MSVLRRTIILNSSRLDASHFQNLIPIGAGFYSQVFKTTYNGYTVAVKILNKDIEPEMIKREIVFYNLENEHVVKVYGWFMRDYQYAIVMELCEGGALSDIASQLTDAQRVYILYYAASGLLYLHSQKLVHRDVKTQNVLIKSAINGGPICAKISDFGLCRQLNINEKKEDLERTTGRYTTVGTPLLMAPEIINNDSVYNEQVDIFMFGLMVLETFMQVTDPDIIRDDSFGIKQEEIMKMDIPMQIKALVLKCCCYDAQDRIRTVQLVSALKVLDAYYNK